MPTEIFGVYTENKTTIKKGKSKNEPSSNKKRGALQLNLFEADANQGGSKYFARRSCVTLS